MRWLEFKQEAERQGLKDDDMITMINWKDYDNQLAVVPVVEGMKTIMRPEKAAEIAEADVKGLPRPSVDC